jgi:hypothetical protein
MALVPGYKFDILISYAHRDNKPLITGHNGWVVELHLALEQRFDELFGKQLKIWRDPYLRWSAAVIPSLFILFGCHPD